jgi:energy-coupling factor transporter ATP-binding protein EcfA2
MAIKRIKVSNFKSFRELDLELGKLNILIGANASGKSNFIQILKFLRDIADSGLQDAVSLQGGMEYLRNLQAPAGEPVSVEVVWDHHVRLSLLPARSGFWPDLYGGRATEARYRFTIAPKESAPGCQVIHDELALSFDLFLLDYESPGMGQMVEGQAQGQGTVTVSNRHGQVAIEIELAETAPCPASDLHLGLAERPDEDILSADLMLRGVPELFRGAPLLTTRIFDFDPKLPKKAAPITGKAHLEEDGSNLALALRAAMASDDTRRMIINLLHDMLPFVEGLDVKHFAEDSLIFRVQETYAKNRPLPAAFVSDGTINLTALLLALYCQESPVIVIEEPERSIHPHLISRVVTWMEEASADRQILVTTHSPELVKHADLESVLLVTRNKDGSSGISRPAEREDVKIFLQNEIGIDELFAQNMLEAPT